MERGRTGTIHNRIMEIARFVEGSDGSVASHAIGFKVRASMEVSFRDCIAKTVPILVTAHAEVEGNWSFNGRGQLLWFYVAANAVDHIRGIANRPGSARQASGAIDTSHISSITTRHVLRIVDAVDVLGEVAARVTIGIICSYGSVDPVTICVLGINVRLTAVNGVTGLALVAGNQVVVK